VPGLASLNGCPDRDGDGVADKDDRCPDVPGLVSLKGCPDTDGDGVADIDDKCPDTPKGWKVDATGCPVDTDGDGVPDAIDKCPTVAGPKENNGCPVEKTAEEIEAEKMKVDPVYFDFNKSLVKADQTGKIDKLVGLLKDNKNYKVNIAGYCDGKGTEAYNLALSKRRAAAVAKAVMKKGIKKAQIASEKGFGKANPVATNDTEEGRALNRRVEFKVVKTN
jgi:outer membrane protein OmpA-like peptidoglycan-associated protein